MISAKIAAQGDIPSKEKKQRKASFQDNSDVNAQREQALTTGKVPQKFKVEFNTGQVTTTNTSSSNVSVDMTPQRSKSEAPANHAITNVLYQVHMKLSQQH